MKQFKISITDKIIEVESIHARPYAICRSFFCDGSPDFKISMTQRDIDQTRKRHAQIYGDNTEPWDGFMETTALLNKVSEHLIDYNTLLLHGAAISINKNAIIFTAPSGTGKTTHIMKWLSNVPEVVVINGDKPFISFNNYGEYPLVYGSPWAGKENLYVNDSAPLKAIVLLERSEDNHIERISFSDAFLFLLQQVYKTDNAGRMRKTLSLLKRLDGSVDLWLFKCNNFKDDCFETAYNSIINSARIVL